MKTIAMKSTGLALVAVALLLLPRLCDNYVIFLLGVVGIYTIVMLSLNVLVGTSGQLSLGHSAFFAIGAFASTILVMKFKAPFLLAMVCGGFLSGIIGLLVGLPATRLRGPYLSIATLAFGILVQHVLREWESVTGGRGGLTAPDIQIGPLLVSSDMGRYYLIIAVTLVCWLMIHNLLKGKIGYAWRALRDTEIAAQSVGIYVSRYKALAFGVSAFFTGIAGALYAPHIGFINYESFGPMLAIAFLSGVILGGLNFTFGSFLGAVYLTLAPELLRGLEQVQMIAYGLVMVVVILFMPRGLMEIVFVLKKGLALVFPNTRIPYTTRES